MASLTFPNAKYLGSIASAPREARGNLVVKDGKIGIGTLSPKKGVVNLRAGATVKIESGVLKKSRAGKAVMFGVLAMGARNVQSATYLTIPLANGEAAVYEVSGIAGPALAAKLRPALAQYGVNVA